MDNTWNSRGTTMSGAPIYIYETSDESTPEQTHPTADSSPLFGCSSSIPLYPEFLSNTSYWDSTSCGPDPFYGSTAQIEGDFAGLAIPDFQNPNQQEMGPGLHSNTPLSSYSPPGLSYSTSPDPQWSVAGPSSIHYGTTGAADVTYGEDFGAYLPLPANSGTSFGSERHDFNVPDCMIKVDNGWICSICKKTCARKRRAITHAHSHTDTRDFVCGGLCGVADWSVIKMLQFIHTQFRFQRL